MTAPTHLHAPDLDALLKMARNRRARFISITDAPPIGAASDAQPAKPKAGKPK